MSTPSQAGFAFADTDETVLSESRKLVVLSGALMLLCPCRTSGTVRQSATKRELDSDNGKYRKQIVGSGGRLDTDVFSAGDPVRCGFEGTSGYSGGLGLPGDHL